MKIGEGSLRALYYRWPRSCVRCSECITMVSPCRIPCHCHQPTIGTRKPDDGRTQETIIQADAGCLVMDCCGDTLQCTAAQEVKCKEYILNLNTTQLMFTVHRMSVEEHELKVHLRSIPSVTAKHFVLILISATSFLLKT